MMGVILGTSKNLSFSVLYPWVNSALKTKNKVVLFLLEKNNGLRIQLEKLGVGVIEYPVENVLPHHERFRLQYQYLKNCNEDYAVITDTRDVLFQEDPIDWLKQNLGSYGVVCASEGLKYKDEFWGDQNLKDGFSYLYEECKNNTIYNVGVLGGKTKDLADLSLMIYTMCKHNPAKVSDQSSFNVLCSIRSLDGFILKTKSEDAWALHAGTLCKTPNFEKFEKNLLEPQPVFDGKIAKTHNGKTYAILHQYDRILGY